jgi:putative oxidoreductase
MTPLHAFRRTTCALVLVCVTLTGCVQRAYDRTIVYELDVSRVPNVQSVGVRGRDKPLSWNSDVAMTQRVAGGPHTVAVTYHTGYLITEVKFTVNGEFELTNQDNRTVRVRRTVTGGDTTVYRATFNVR